jgi:hypothetical protein
LRFFCNVRLEWQSAPTERSNFGGELFGLTGFRIDDDAISAFAGESDDDRMGARVLRAGDQDDFVFKSHSKISSRPMRQQAVSNKKRLRLQISGDSAQPHSRKKYRNGFDSRLTTAVTTK